MLRSPVVSIAYCVEMQTRSTSGGGGGRGERAGGEDWVWHVHLGLEDQHLGMARILLRGSGGD